MSEELARQQAAGLRALADMIEVHPELAHNFSHTFGYSGINAHPQREDVAAELADIARIALRSGAKVTKDISEKFHNLVLDFGAVKVDVLAYREQVCERVVVGTREITEEIPDPDQLAAVPTVTQTRTEDIVKWRCTPLLSRSDGGRDA